MTRFLTRATVKGVELVKAGRWQGLTGPVELTREDLADAVAASRDPEVDHAALKLGHVDPRFDGQPAAGWVENLRLSEDGSTMLGDLVDMPTKLAAIMPTAYRRRSVELRRAVTTPSGKTYRAVLSGLALLGVTAPAVKGLADVLTHYASEGSTPGHDDDAAQAGVEVLQLGEGTDTGPVPHVDAAPVDDGNEPPGPGRDTLKEDGMTPEMKAHLVAVLGLEADATDEQVEAALAEQAENAATERANNDTTATTDDDKAPQAGNESTPVEGPTGTPATGTAGTPASGDALSAGLPAGMVAVPAATFESMKEQLAHLVKADQDRQTEAMLSEALQAGRIGPSEMEAWRANLSAPATREGAATMLSALPARYPVTMLGAGDASDSDDLAALHAQADALGL